VGESARYVYAITRGVDAQVLADVRGLQGGPVERVSHHGLDAVVSDVPLDTFGEEGLKRNLEDLGWLEQVARAHDDVVRAVAAHGPTAPLRLATICLDDDGVRARLDEWGDDLVEVLDRVTGRGEWSVKVVAPVAPDADEPGSEPTSGAEFLRRRKARSEQRAQRHSTANAVAEEVHHELAGRAVASRLLPPQDPQLTGLTGTMLLNAAYLVDLDHAGDFAAVVDGIAARHPEVTVDGAGPWPPYSFAVLEQS
jgi:hypothetical protein